MFTTEELVTVDGVPLQTYAWNLKTLTGRLGVPGAKGGNSTVAMRSGARWRRKQWESKTETWSMWVLGCDEDGLIPPHGSRAQFTENLMALHRLFAVRDRELDLTKTVRTPDGDLLMSALGEVVSAWDPTSMAGGTRATFSVDMHLADPFWYGQPIEFTIQPGQTAVQWEMPGTVRADRMLIHLDNVGNATLSNDTLGVSVTTDVDLPAGETMTLDTDRFAAVTGLGANRVGRITHSGAVSWMELAPGTNFMSLDGIGAGEVTVTVKPVYVA